jgi:carbon-monoxide dehydrogenase medium subunit
MREFEYRRVRDAASASALLREHPSAKLLAGGQSLLASMRMGLLETELLVDLQDVPEMRSVTLLADGRLEVGAMMSHGAIACHSGMREFAPGLAALAGNIADGQVRNMGTIGGSLANADPSACWAAGVLAVGGEIRTSHRTIAVDDFFTGLFSTALEADEVLVGVRLKRPRRFAYIKHEQAASRFAMVGVAVADYGTEVRVAVNGTMDGAIRVPLFEQALARNFGPSALAGLAVDDSLMPSDIHAGADYRAHLAQVLCRRAVARITQGGAS